MKKNIPYAVASYEELREKNYFFVDKTSFIREIERYKVPVFLRPRRFGKSLWCSLLECYYDIKRKEKFNYLFGDLHIGKEPTEERNKYLVLRFDFSKVEVKSDLKFIERTFSDIFKGAIDVFTTYYKKYFKDFLFYKEDTRAVSNILSDILSFIKKKQSSSNLPDHR
ncbi:MAG: AAA family ATPase [bacterium]